MLEEIRISGLGVIDDVALEFGSGLTVLTGETGAGKTMVVQGLNLLFGGRADPTLVRPSAGQAVVEGRLAVAADSSVLSRALDAGAELDDGSLLISRSVSAHGRSRAYVGGRAVPVGLLAELAGDLVSVHGQSEAQRLLRTGAQRAALDRFAGEPLIAVLAAYRTTFAGWHRAEAELAELVGRRRERVQEADLLRFGLAEVDAVGPVPGEDTALAGEVGRLAHADALRRAALTAHELVVGEPDNDGAADVSGLLGRARREVEAQSGHDPELAALAERLAEASYLLADVSADLASYGQAVEVDPSRLAVAQERQAALASLQRKYGPTVADITRWAAAGRERLASLDLDDDRVDRLSVARDALLDELVGLADQLAGSRKQAAERFSAAVSGELTALAMPQAAVAVGLERRAELGPYGSEEVELLLTAHRGAAPRPLHRGASGGELARVMLAVEVVFAGADPVPTMVFDEVDAGVGGRAAVEVGRRLAALSRHHQVVVITHLPQVAAFADHHLHVEKSQHGSVTRSGVTTLDGSGRVLELSRMLAGQAESDMARGHAHELLAAAASAKSD